MSTHSHASHLAPGARRGRPLLLLLGLLAGCPQPPPPAPTVATLQPSRAGVTTTRGGQALAASQLRRVESGTEVRTAAGVRASLLLDLGAWVLLDGGSTVIIDGAGLELRGGRAWIDARGADPVKIQLAGRQVTLTLQSAGLSVSAEPDGGARAYCAAGQVTWQAGAGGGRLESGLSLIYQKGQARETAQSLWEDWTAGLAEPGPLRPQEPAGVGQLLARRADEIGNARAPLIVRRHEVRVHVTADLAVTEVEQTFFNPRSDVLDGIYAVRIPEGAILGEFAIGEEGGGLTPAVVVPRARGGEQAYGNPLGQLEWAGAGRYRGLLRALLPGKTKVVRLRYTEWLPHLHDAAGARRRYVYPMGQSDAAMAGAAPNLGEFTLEVDLREAQAGALEAGMGAQVEGNRVVLRRSDFRPHADFYLDLLDPKERRPELLEAFRGAPQGGERYLLTQPILDAGPAPASLELVLVVDVSAGTDDARLDLARATAQALLQQLGKQDRVAVLAASVSTRSLGREAMGPATSERIEELIAALGKQAAGGATDLGAAFTRATELLPPGRGAIVYLGDGRPTTGLILPSELRDHLRKAGPLPRMYAVAIGAAADQELLAGLCGGASAVLRVEDRPDAVRAAAHILERAAQPALTDVAVSLGEGADVVFPERPISIEAGEALTVIARLRPDRPAPERLLVSGLREGAHFQEERAIKLVDIDDQRDQPRRWAQERLLRLLARGAGREAASDIGTRFGVVTPWTALIIASSSGQGYARSAGEEDRGTFIPPALLGRPPQDTPLAFEQGVSTTPTRTISLDDLYLRALEQRQAPARVCYERKAAGHPELSGRVVLRVKIGLDGAVVLTKVLSSTLRDRDVEACMERAVSALRLPASPDGKLHEVSFAVQLEQQADDEPRTCSPASRAYLSVRRALWRERLARSPGPGGAMTVWRQARARCELRTWVDRRALLDLMRPAAGRVADQVDLYHRYDGDTDQSEAQEYLRREILQAVRTREDVQAVQAGLSLDGGIDPALVDQELARARTTPERIAVVRHFLQLSPGAIAIKLRLLQLLELAGQREEALRLCDSLRRDPGSDTSVRQAVGEFLLRAGNGAEGAQAFSEIVESAPFDPWGRRRLGDLYHAYGLDEAAYREYQMLGWLLPQDDTVLLLLANSAFQSGRIDEALRLLARVAETMGARPGQNGAAPWARALYTVRLAQLREAAQKKGDKNLLGQLAVRGRDDGIAGYAGQLFVALLTVHPDVSLQLFAAPPGGKDEVRAAVQGGAVGIEAQRYESVGAGEMTLSIRRGEAARGEAKGEVMVIEGSGSSAERLHRFELQMPATEKEIRMVLRGGEWIRR